MSGNKVDEILEAIEHDQRDKIILEIESLKPWKYTGIIEYIIRAALLVYIVFYIQEGSILLDTKVILLTLVLFLFGDRYSDHLVHKRIDAVVHLINCRTIGK